MLSCQMYPFPQNFRVSFKSVSFWFRGLISLSVIVCVGILHPVKGQASDADYYAKAKKAAKAQQYDFAFMYYKNIVDSSHPRVQVESLFALGEYYDMSGQARDADRYFRSVVERHPKSKWAFFSLAHRYYLARRTGDKKLADVLRKEIVTFQQVSLVFRKSETMAVSSPMQRRYVAEFLIDQIHVRIHDNTLVSISY